MMQLSRQIVGLLVEGNNLAASSPKSSIQQESDGLKLGEAALPDAKVWSLWSAIDDNTNGKWQRL